MFDGRRAATKNTGPKQSFDFGHLFWLFVHFAVHVQHVFGICPVICYADGRFCLFNTLLWIHYDAPTQKPNHSDQMIQLFNMVPPNKCLILIILFIWH